jgi:hypothetical protein
MSCLLGSWQGKENGIGQEHSYGHDRECVDVRMWSQLDRRHGPVFTYSADVNPT